MEAILNIIGSELVFNAIEGCCEKVIYDGQHYNIDIFEDEGFIWGGKWMIWDNMHFEYHPELILFNKIE